MVSSLPGSAVAALVPGNRTRRCGAALVLSAGYALLGVVVSLAICHGRGITA